MPDLHYSRAAPEGSSARAIGREIDISMKHAVNICTWLRGRRLRAAQDLLAEVVALKRAVPFRRFSTMVPHRRGAGFGAGRYPVKAAAAILRVLENVENNAEQTALDVDDLVITHLAAHKGRIWMGYRPRAHGRSTPWRHDTVHIEVIVEPPAEKEGEEDEEGRKEAAKEEDEDDAAEGGPAGAGEDLATEEGSDEKEKEPAEDGPKAPSKARAPKQVKRKVKKEAPREG